MTPVQQYAVVVPRIPNNVHTAGFLEIAETVHHGLIALGYDSILTDVISIPGRRTILFAAHLIDIESTPPADAIIYNWEQLGSTTMPAIALVHPYTVWDFSTKNVAFWRANGIDARHVPIGYTPEMTRIEKSTPDIDVLFYGGTTRRRIRVLNSLRARGFRVHADFAAYGEEKDSLIARSKVVLNLHAFETLQIFESARVFYPLANEVCVVSEDGEEDTPFRGAAVIVPHSEIVDTCGAYVRDEARRIDQARRGLAVIRTIDERAILRAALDDRDERWPRAS